MEGKIVMYAGLSKLDGEEQATVRRIVEGSVEEVRRLVKELGKLKVTVKTHHAAGKRKLYILFLAAETDKGVFTVAGSEADIKKSKYFDVATASHKAVEALKWEMKRKLKADMQPWKKRMRLERANG
ncbi:MAG TPA: hypothetical protein VFE88_04615 [Candidatus Nanoarchaeia archaeon]|nr:hypothetical protein [Candidatus Nanoarchaeia archaeon]